MRRRFPWKALAAGGLTLGWVSAVVAMTRRKAVPPERVALIGDSYAVGLGPELANLFPDFKFEGHVGTTTAQWAAHSKACGECGDWLTAFKPTVVVVALGANDGVAPKKNNYQTIVKGLHGIGARVIWLEPPAGANTLAVRGVIASLGVQTVDLTGAPLASDGVHPTSYVPWAKEITEAIRG